jgi:uncharacterized RDD family membrane protein YckC
VELDDRITIATPEGVEVTLQLAGLGSRFIAGVADLLVQGLATVVLAIVTGVTLSGGSAAAVVFVIGAFLIWFAYPIAFEVLASGRTPGKRWTHLRVVRESGAAVDLPASAIRNLMRLLDGPPLMYLPSAIGIAITARNQRPGDVAAGTLVIRDTPGRSEVAAGRQVAVGPDAPVVPAAQGQAWDVSAVTPSELAAVRSFLERRDTLDRGPRAQLALRLAQGLRAKVAGASEQMPAERFLEELVRRRSRRA